MPTSFPGRVLTVIGRPGCHLCVDAERIVERVAADLGLAVVHRRVDEDPELARFGDLVPVVLIDGEPHQHWRIDEARLRSALTGPPTRWWRRGR